MSVSVYMERQRTLARRVARYRRRPTAVEHEALVPLVTKYFGESSAEFFDQEGSLPLRTSGWLVTGPEFRDTVRCTFPWPLHKEAVERYVLVVVALGLFAGLETGVTLARVTSLPWTMLCGLLVAAAVWFGISPLLGKLLPPKDLAERQRRVATYVAIRAKHQDAAERAREERELR